MSSSWLPSSDDESDELDAMHTKLESLRQRGDARQKKRHRAWYEEEEDDDDEESPVKRPKRITCHRAFDEDSDASSSSVDLMMRSREESHADPPSTRKEQAPDTVQRPVEPHDDNDDDDDASSFADDERRVPVQEIRASPESPSCLHNDASSYQSSGASSHDGNDNDDDDALYQADEHPTTHDMEFDNDPFILDDAALEQALTRAEAESSSRQHQQYQQQEREDDDSSVGLRENDTAESATRAPEISLFSTTNSSSASSSSPSITDWSPKEEEDTAAPNRTQTEKRVARDDRRQATEQEEAWIQDYLQQEQQQKEEEAPTPPERSHSKAPSPTREHVPPTSTSTQASEASSPKADAVDTAMETNPQEEGEDWVQELLRQQEQQARGQLPPAEMSVAEVTLASPAGATFMEQASHAFGFSPSPVPKATLGQNQSDEKNSGDDDDDDEPLEIPTRDDPPINDAIDRDERYLEVDPSCYPLVSNDNRRAPMVHHFTAESHPPAVRRRLPVVSIFNQPQVATFFLQKFENFNTMQSELANMLAHSDDHVVVAAPTGAGKTAVFEMAMARFFMVDLMHGGDGRSTKSTPGAKKISKRRKIVYISPSKALCEERLEDWTRRVAETKLDIEVSAVTGDGDPGEAFREVAAAQIILTTPEKWDSLTRRWTEKFVLFASVKVVLVDEVHMLADPTRGPCLESIMVRMKFIQHVAENVMPTQEDIRSSSFVDTTPDALGSPLRIIAVSATLPNIDEIAEFITASEAYVFDQSFRPVPLTKHVLGLGNASNNWWFSNSLEKQVPDIVLRFAEGRPTIVFCHSKAETERMAEEYSKPGSRIAKHDNHHIAGRTNNRKLQMALVAGLAYHNASMDLNDRHLVEEIFAQGKIRVLFATTTIAVGVNLPARLVIVKGTKAYRGPNGYQDIDQASLLQMLGRAGRPGHDDKGVAVVMTDNASKPKFQRLLTAGLPPAQSQLMSTLDEALNSEVSQNVISGMASAVQWMKQTLHYVQLRRDPEAHSIRVVSDHSIDTHLMGLLRESLKRLQQTGAVAIREGSAIQPLDGSSIMSNHMVDQKTMQLLTGLPFDVTLSGVLKAICKIEKLQRPVRRAEKRTLNALHKGVVRFKLDGPLSKARVQEPWEKVFVLLQASIDRSIPQEFGLSQETSQMVDFASRMLSAAEEVGARCTKNAVVAVKSLLLRRSLETSLWNHQKGVGVLAQFESLQDQTIQALKFSGINTFDDVINHSGESLEKIAHKTAPFGADLKNAVERILSSSLKVQAHVGYAEGTEVPKVVHVALEGRNVEAGTSSSSSTEPDVTYTVVAHTDRPGGILLYKRGVSKPSDFTVPIPPKFGFIVIQLLASMAGLDDTIRIEGNTENFRPVDCTNEDPNARKKKKVSTKKIARAPESQASQKPRTTPRTETRSQPQRRDRRISDYLSQKAPARASVEQPAGRTPATESGRTQILEQASQYLSTQSRSIPAHLGTSSLFPSETQPETSPQYLPSQQGTAASTLFSPGFSPQPVAPMKTSTVTPPSGDQPKQATSRDISAQRGTSVSKRFARGISSQPTALSETTTVTRPNETQPKNKQQWKQARREQARVQKRVFARDRENPFAAFTHDPNDAEDLIDSLSTKAMNSPSGIIPDRALKLLNELRPAPTTCAGSGNQHRRRSLQRRQRMGAQRNQGPVDEYHVMNGDAQSAYANESSLYQHQRRFPSQQNVMETQCYPRSVDRYHVVHGDAQSAYANESSLHQHQRRFPSQPKVMEAHRYQGPADGYHHVRGDAQGAYADERYQLTPMYHHSALVQEPMPPTFMEDAAGFRGGEFASRPSQEYQVYTSGSPAVPDETEYSPQGVRTWSHSSTTRDGSTLYNGHPALAPDDPMMPNMYPGWVQPQDPTPRRPLRGSEEEIYAFF